MGRNMVAFREADNHPVGDPRGSEEPTDMRVFPILLVLACASPRPPTPSSGEPHQPMTVARLRAAAQVRR